MAVAGNKTRKVFDNRYEVVAIVGRGSGSVVYHARHVSPPHAEVALKVLIDQGDDTPNSDRLRKEALAMISCRHKHVLRLDDFHAVGSLSYLCLEYAPESDLRKYVTKLGGRLGSSQAELFLNQTAQGLAAIHKAQLIHRDIKPDNILVVNHREIRICDFGIAQLPGEPSSLEELEAGVGTMSYMAPEVLEGTPYNHSMDLYALSVSFYEMISGTHPFESAPLIKQLEVRQDKNLTPLIELVPSVPQYLSDIIMKGMSYNPADRFQSAHDFYESIEARRLVSERGATVHSLSPMAERNEGPLNPPLQAQILPFEAPRVAPVHYANLPANSEVTPNPAAFPFESETPQNVVPHKLPEYEQFGEKERGSTTLSSSERTMENVENDSYRDTQFSPAPFADPLGENPPSLNPEELHRLGADETLVLNSSDIEGLIESDNTANGSTSIQNAPESGRGASPSAQEDYREELAEDTLSQDSRRNDPSGVATFSNARIAANSEGIKKPKVASFRSSRARRLALPIAIITAALLIFFVKDLSRRSHRLTVKGNDTLSAPTVPTNKAKLPDFSGGELSFPNLPAGVYSGSINRVIANEVLPLTIISFPEKKKLAIMIGIEGWTPKVVSIDDSPGGEVKKTIHVASNGFIIDLSGANGGQGNKNGELRGSFRNIISGESGQWRLSPVNRTVTP